MGVYDMIEVGDRDGQVKCWEDTLHLYRENDTVPDLNGYNTYSIAMREGGYVNVVLNRLMTWTDAPVCTPIFDKYGSEFSPTESTGILGEPYIHGIKVKP